MKDKILLGEKIDLTESKMEYWSDHHKNIFLELEETVNNLHNIESNALSLKSYQTVLQSEKWDKNWLTSLDEHESLSEWIILNDEANKFNQKLLKLSSLHNESKQWLNDQFNTKLNQIVEKSYLAHKIYFLLPSSAFGFQQKRENQQFTMIESTSLSTNSDNYKGYGIGKHDWLEEKCHLCNSGRAFYTRKIKIEWYHQLVWLLDLKDRNQLHPYFQNFRSNRMIQYKGNSILNQTHPFLAIKDPMSKIHINGFNLKLFICKRCHTKLLKNKPKTILIDQTNLTN